MQNMILKNVNCPLILTSDDCTLFYFGNIAIGACSLLQFESGFLQLPQIRNEKQIKSYAISTCAIKISYDNEQYMGLKSFISTRKISHK